MARVLVVEDEDAVREFVGRALQHHGHEVEVAIDGLDGLTRISGSSFDLMITDIVMPGLDGFEVIKRLDAHAATKRIPIIVLTSSSLSTIEKRRLAGRISHLSSKSEFDRDEFVALLKSATRRS